MPTLCNIAKINNITIEAYEEIEKLNKTFILYSEITLKFEKNDAQLSDVIPEFLSLIINLDKPGMHPQLTSALKTDLIYRTECIFNTQSKNFNPIFGLATFLDPTNRKYLNIEFPLITLRPLNSKIKTFLCHLCEDTVHPQKKQKIILTC